MANQDLPPNTVVVDARQQQARFASGFAVTPPPNIEDEIGPPIVIFQDPPVADLPAPTPPRAPIPHRAEAEREGPRPADPGPKTREFLFRIGSFGIKVPVIEHVVTDEIIHVFAIPNSSPVSIQSPRQELVSVTTPEGKVLELVSAGISFPFGGNMSFSIFLEPGEEGADE